MVLAAGFGKRTNQAADVAGHQSGGAGLSERLRNVDRATFHAAALQRR